MRVQKVYSGQPGAAEGGAVVRQEFYVGCGDFNIQLIGSFYVRDVVIFDCIQESVGEDQDEMVRRRGGRVSSLEVGESWGASLLLNASSRLRI